ncbi:TLC domain-containing protein [Limtongia smithiae]|uniref:TLC domain-containing protein n=1 Tax=Limtongia smithiae TaxID=1125753 RepID=UPI0034CF4DD3
MSTLSPPPPNTRSRTSSLGQFSLGDTAAPSLSTMEPTLTQIRGSEKRQRALSGAMQPDLSPGSTAAVPLGGEKAVSSTASTEKTLGTLAWLWMSYSEVSYRKKWVTPLILASIPPIAFALSSVHDSTNPIWPFLCASYRIEPTEEGGQVMYGKGPLDFAFVFYYMIVFSFIREFVMQQILEPIAKMCGLRRGKVKRFMEQTYSMVYYGVMSPWGLYIMRHMPLWYFQTRPMYEMYPHKTHELDFKLYYLLQAAFWSQQSMILSLQVEKPRSDFKELVFHHIITIALIFCSYRFHFTWIGIAVYITMDTSDFVLAMSKTLNYLNYQFIGPFFGFFMVVWIYTRHYLSLRILWSVATEFRTVGDFQLNWDTQQYKCWISQYITFALLASLQAVNVYWLCLIIRVAYKYVFLKVAKDERSDDEDEEDEVPGEEDKKEK